MKRKPKTTNLANPLGRSPRLTGSRLNASQEAAFKSLLNAIYQDIGADLAEARQAAGETGLATRAEIIEVTTDAGRPQERLRSEIVTIKKGGRASYFSHGCSISELEDLLTFFDDSDSRREFDRLAREAFPHARYE